MTRGYYVRRYFMKRTVFFLALALGATAVFGQGSVTDSKKDQAVTTLNDTGAVTSPVIQSVPADSTRIKAPAPQPSGLAENADVINLWKLIQSGGWAMIPLGIMSVITFMMVLVNLFTLRRSAILTAHYMNTADVLLKKRDYLGLLAISSRHSEAVARIVQRTLDFATKNPTASFEIVRDIAESEGSGQAASLQHRPTYLADIGMLSPMVGLLGTVSGIIRSFGVLAKGQADRARDVLLAEGVSEALVATASGLIVGIIAFAAYAHFRNKVQGLISDMEGASAHLLGLVALNYNKKREASRVALEDEF
jgi:biopolymer transport protein ExbB